MPTPQIPLESQRLNVDICDDKPANSTQYLQAYYCDPGFYPSDEGTRCLEPTTPPLEGKTIIPTTARGVGGTRYYFDKSSTDRGFYEDSFKQTYMDSSTWGTGPAIDDKFRAAIGAYWTWNKEMTEIVYLYGAPLRQTLDPVELEAGTRNTEEELEIPFRIVLTAGRSQTYQSVEHCLPPVQWREYVDEWGTNTGNVTQCPLTPQEIKIYANSTHGFWPDYPKHPGQFDPSERRSEANGGVRAGAEIDKLYELTKSIFPGVFESSGESEWYYDHTFELTLPSEGLSSANIGSGLMYYDVKPSYNYYIPKYEFLLESRIKESILPNMYALLIESLNESFLQGEQTPQNPELLRHILLGKDWIDDPLEGTLQKEIENLIQGYRVADQNTGLTTFGIAQKDSYFKSYVDAYYASSDDAKSCVERKGNNFIIPHTAVGTLATINPDADPNQNYLDRKKIFPMSVDLEFSTPTDNTGGLTSELKKDIINRFLMRSISNDAALAEEEKMLDNKESVEFVEYLGTPIMVDDTYSSVNIRRSMDLREWHNLLTADTPSTDNQVIASYLDSLSDPTIHDGEPPCNSPYTTTSLHLNNPHDADSDFGASLADAASSYSERLGVEETGTNGHSERWYDEILRGKKAKTEIAMYRIEKLDSEGKTLQNFYLPDSSEISIHKYIDTQVKYGKEYTYKVYAWVIVYGLRYKYYNLTKVLEFGDEYRAGPTGNHISIKAIEEPSTKLIEVPYFVYKNKILDKPAIAPNVDIIPYHGVNNKIMINLHSGTGHEIKTPIIIENSEVEEMVDIVRSQNIFTGDELKVEYKSDDFASKYRIYRLDTHPESYLDFANGNIREVDTPFAASASIDEKITPNKKYWYTFRSVDSHGHLSSPTPVYQVEVVDDGASIYPLVDTVELKTINTKIPSKSLKRLMHIMPNIGHYIFDPEVEEKIENDRTAQTLTPVELRKLGVREQSLWGKQFKIRLTSNKTGKKVDINIKFKNNEE